MDPAIIVATVAAVPAIIGGTMGGYAALKQRGNENLSLVITAMQEHMKTLSSENEDLRQRVTASDSKTNEALIKLAECETQRKDMQRELHELTERMNSAESS